MKLNPDQHKLSDDERQTIFEKRIKSDIFADANPSNQPIAIIFGGQPGAGKSATVANALDELKNRGSAVQIIGDD